MQQTPAGRTLDAIADGPPGIVSFKPDDSVEIQGTVLRLTPHSAVFEVYSPQAILRLSQVLTKFKVLADERVVYAGKAVVVSLINSGTGIICEAALEEPTAAAELIPANLLNGSLTAGFDAFLQRWQQFCCIVPEFKAAVADLRSFLAELRAWLDGIELTISAMRADARSQALEKVLQNVPADSSLRALFERFELAAKLIPADFAPAHRRYCTQQLHSLLLLSPFNHRIFTKPLGYAGDYKMIEMIIRNAPEGETLFAKLIHSYILAQVPARSVRNRATYFTSRFVQETARVSRLGREARIYSLGCGPACEVQTFIAEQALSDHAEFRLLDFNEETLAYTKRRTEELKLTHHRRTPIHVVKQSVYNLLKSSSSCPDDQQYDMIYCSGLYDYLNDRVCKALNTYLYDKLSPGGVLIVTNFDPCNPIRNLMEYAFEWFLIHRTASELRSLSPGKADPEECCAISDPTGCNVFLEIRKPR